MGRLYRGHDFGKGLFGTACSHDTDKGSNRRARKHVQICFRVEVCRFENQRHHRGVECAGKKSVPVGIGLDLDPWIASASASLIASFAGGITRDKEAVRTAITEPWSNGQTEGQITKLKLVKRQVYGRANIDLLQARLIGAA